MKRLWLADVHANLPALEAVLEDAGPVDTAVFLGDFIGYGPFPSECVDLLRALDGSCIVGNHDTAVLALRGDAAPREDTAHAIWEHWTLEQLDDDQLDYLDALPESLTMVAPSGPIEVIHAAPFGGYLHPGMPDWVFAKAFGEVPGTTVFIGHSHRHIDRNIDGHRLVCIRAVGQPRDGAPRAGYTLEQDGAFEDKRVAYDIERTVRATERLGLPEPFLTRWLRFLTTGRDVEWFPEYDERSEE